jgi:PAS domain S-box-containing protein
MSDTGHKVSASSHANPVERNFGVLLELVPDAIVMVDSAGSIALVNTHAEKLFGYSPGELLGKPLETLLPVRFRIRHAEHAGNYFAQPRRRPMGTAIELFGLRKDGSEFPAEISLSPVPTENGAWAMSAIRDITDRKRIEQELKEKNAALEAANQELQAFSYSVSHDLRAPLRAMNGFAGMLKKSLGPNLPQETGHALKRIQDNAAKMSKLIDGLLDFSSLTWMALTKKTVNTAELAQSVFHELTLSAGGRRVDFKIGTLPACRADAVLLRQVFANLFSNALKFTRERDPVVIRVGCHQEKGEHVYFVQDNGAGFDMEYSGKLFRVFQRLHSPSEFEGTGVGLAIVQRIVQRHGGRVWAESEVDRGATFYFTLGESSHGNSA